MNSFQQNLPQFLAFIQTLPEMQQYSLVPGLLKGYKPNLQRY